MNTCAFVKPDGNQCKARPAADSTLCTFHNPKTKAAVREGRRAGAKVRTATPPPTPDPGVEPLAVETVADVLAAAKDTLNRVRSRALGFKEGSAIASLLNVALSALKQGEASREVELVERVRPLKDMTPEQMLRVVEASHRSTSGESEH